MDNKEKSQEEMVKEAVEEAKKAAAEQAKDAEAAEEVKEAETADYYIEHFAHENSRRFDITVVTSDGLEQVIIRGQGCTLVSSREFEKEVKRAEDFLRQEYLERKQESDKVYLGEFLPEEI